MKFSDLRKRIGRRLSYELADAQMLGLGYAKHVVAKSRGKSRADFKLDGFPVVLRPCDTDLASFRTVFSDKVYEIPVESVRDAIASLYRQILGRGRRPVIVDAGANVGAASLWFRKQYPEAHIVAVEPDRACFEITESNLGADPAMQVIHAGIGGSPGHLQLIEYENSSWAIQSERADSGIPIVTMDELFSGIEDGEPFIAKFNIEGFEEDVFAENLGWLDHTPVVFVEPHDWRFPEKHTSRTFQKAFGDRYFQLFVVGPGIAYVRADIVSHSQQPSSGSVGRPAF